MVNKIPVDLQLVICHHAIGQFGNDPFVMTAMTVSKVWAYFVCQLIYRHFHIKNYLKFASFVKTITSPKTILPYGSFVRTIDLSPVNKYGIDMKAARLMRCCPNIVEMRLGHPTTLRPETIQHIAEYNNHLHTLHMGGIESFPFMLECDFSQLKRLKHVTLETTPLLTESLMTLPSKSLLSLCLNKMDAIEPKELYQFCERHPNLQSLALINCRALMIASLGEILSKLISSENNVCRKLVSLHLEGPQITDEIASDMFKKSIPADSYLREVRLSNTSVTKKYLDTMLYQHAALFSATQSSTVSGSRMITLALTQDRLSFVK